MEADSQTPSAMISEWQDLGANPPLSPLSHLEWNSTSMEMCI